MSGTARVPWWALAMAGVLLALALGAAGFAIGAGSAPDERDARADQAQARAVAFRIAKKRAAGPEFKVAFADALPDGRIAGKARGAKSGRKAGEAAAEADAQRERDRIASQLADCPDFSDIPVFDISVRGVDCAVGSGLIREYFSCGSSNCTLSNGWSCSILSSQEFTSESRCTDGLRAVRFSTGD